MAPQPHKRSSKSSASARLHDRSDLILRLGHKAAEVKKKREEALKVQKQQEIELEKQRSEVDKELKSAQDEIFHDIGSNDERMPVLRGYLDYSKMVLEKRKKSAGMTSTRVEELEHQARSARVQFDTEQGDIAMFVDEVAFDQAAVDELEQHTLQLQTQLRELQDVVRF